MIGGVDTRSLPWVRVRSARARIPAPRFSRYIHHNTWHVCPFSTSLPFDSDEWIEVEWG